MRNDDGKSAQDLARKMSRVGSGHLQVHRSPPQLGSQVLIGRLCVQEGGPDAGESRARDGQRPVALVRCKVFLSARYFIWSRKPAFSAAKRPCCGSIYAGIKALHFIFWRRSAALLARSHATGQPLLPAPNARHVRVGAGVRAARP